MARVKILKPEVVDDPIIADIFEWVTKMEGAVPNHFYVEMNFPEFFVAKLGATMLLWEAGELTMEEVQKVGILVSKDNGCPYCTAAFCTILSHGLGNDEEVVADLVRNGADSVSEPRQRTLLNFALKVNRDPKAIEDSDIDALREVGLTDKGVVQLVHLVSDFGSYNRLNLALDTDYDYRDMWRALVPG